MTSELYVNFYDDQEEIRLQLLGIGAGWTFEQFGELSLFDEHDNVDFPGDWSDLHQQVATQVVQSQWRLHSAAYIEQSLQTGISYSLAAGDRGEMAADTELTEHLMRRPLVSADCAMKVKLHGEATSSGFNGRVSIWLNIQGQF